MSETDSSAPAPYATISLEKVCRRVKELDELIPQLVAEREGLRSILTLANDPRFSWPGASTDAAPKRPRKARAFTHKTMVLKVLEKASVPLGVREILDAIEEEFGERLERTSVSPLLRKLERAGEVRHHAKDAKWSAADSSREEADAA